MGRITYACKSLDGDGLRMRVNANSTSRKLKEHTSPDDFGIMPLTSGVEINKTLAAGHFGDNS